MGYPSPSSWCNLKNDQRNFDHFSSPLFPSFVLRTQPTTVVRKVEAQLDYVHIAYIFCTVGADLYGHSVLINKKNCIRAQSEVD